MDAAYIVNDDSLREAAQYATSKVLQAAIDKIGDYDLILCEELALDTLSSQRGSRLAAMLDIPLISYAKELKMGDSTVEALKEYEDIADLYEVLSALTEKL